MVILPSRMEDCLARSLSPTSSLRSEHAANRLWIFSDPALMQGSLLRTVLHRGHMCSLEIQVFPLVVFLELVTSNSAAMIFIVV